MRGGCAVTAALVDLVTHQGTAAPDARHNESVPSARAPLQRAYPIPGELELFLRMFLPAN